MVLAVDSVPILAAGEELSLVGAAEGVVAVVATVVGAVAEVLLLAQLKQHSMKCVVSSRRVIHAGMATTAGKHSCV